jgi:hypothetical protein
MINILVRCVRNFDDHPIHRVFRYLRVSLYTNCWQQRTDCRAEGPFFGFSDTFGGPLVDRILQDSLLPQYESGDFSVFEIPSLSVVGERLCADGE